MAALTGIAALMAEGWLTRTPAFIASGVVALGASVLISYSDSRPVFGIPGRSWFIGIMGSTLPLVAWGLLS